MNSRNIGVDLLRGLAAFMVVILHCLSFTGCLDLKTSYINFHVYYLVNCFAFCAVNIFGLISGYIGYTSEKKEEYHLSRILHLYITVLSYSLGILALYCIKNNVFIFSRGHIKYFTPFLFRDMVVPYGLCCCFLLHAIYQCLTKYLRERNGKADALSHCDTF